MNAHTLGSSSASNSVTSRDEVATRALHATSDFPDRVPPNTSTITTCTTVTSLNTRLTWSWEFSTPVSTTVTMKVTRMIVASRVPSVELTSCGSPTAAAGTSSSRSTGACCSTNSDRAQVNGRASTKEVSPTSRALSAVRPSSDVQLHLHHPFSRSCDKDSAWLR